MRYHLKLTRCGPCLGGLPCQLLKTHVGPELQWDPEERAVHWWEVGLNLGGESWGRRRLWAELVRTRHRSSGGLGRALLAPEI
jgi:hypothetical protein